MQYPPPFAATLPSTDATFTIRPRACLMRGRKVIVMPITPFMFTFSVLWKSSTFIHSDGPMGNERPALFTRPQSPTKQIKRQNKEKMMLCFVYRLTLCDLIMSYNSICNCRKSSLTLIANLLLGPLHCFFNAILTGHIQQDSLQIRPCHSFQIISSLFCETAS